MRHHFSRADSFSRPHDCGRVAIADRFVIRRRRPGRPVCRTHRQVFQKALSGRKRLMLAYFFSGSANTYSAFPYDG